MKRTIVPASVLLFLVTSALFVAAIFFREPFEYAYAQLYPTPVPTGGYNCSMNVGCCEGNKTKVAYLSCDGGVACNENDCRPVGQGACVYIAGNNCEVSTCHPTYCYDTGGLGGCPGGIGSIDDCGGVSCNSCDGGGGGGEPTPTGGGSEPPLAYCGDGNCDSLESCSTCPSDCGGCPGTVRAQAVIISSGVSSCAQVRAGTDYLSATMRLTPNVAPGSQTASGGTFARWTDAPSRTYTLSSTVGAGYVLKYACWRTNAPVAQGSSLTADLPSGATLTWDLGYTVGAAWYQARGGDVYAASGLASPVPAGVSPRVMLQSGTPGLPGVVTYGASYDFDSSTGTGRDLVSSTGWLANDTYPATDFYTMMYNRFDSPDPTHTGDTTFTGKPASGTYMVEGNLVIDNAAWNVGRD